MKKPILVLLALLCSLGVVGAKPPEPPKLSGKRLSGGGTCQVHYGSDGLVDRATITRSSGSDLLDKETLESAKRYWRGLPNSTAQVPFKYTEAPVLAELGRPMHYKTPLPPYPPFAQKNGVQGSGIIQVLFDAQGKPEYAAMAKSTGSKELDESAVRFAQANWRSSGGEEGTMTLPINYRLRGWTPDAARSRLGSTGSNIARPDTSRVQALVTL